MQTLPQTTDSPRYEHAEDIGYAAHHPHPGQAKADEIAAGKGIRVTAVDLETGETATKEIQPGNYVIVVATPCYVASELHYANGTTMLTLKGRDRGLFGTSWVRPDAPDGA